MKILEYSDLDTSGVGRQYKKIIGFLEEEGSSNPYCRKLFSRRRTGYYILNPGLSIRVKEDWIDIYSHLNIGLISEVSQEPETCSAALQSLISGGKDPDDQIF